MQINKYENVSVSQAESFEYRTESWRHCLVVKPLIQSELLFTTNAQRGNVSFSNETGTQDVLVSFVFRTFNLPGVWTAIFQRRGHARSCPTLLMRPISDPHRRGSKYKLPTTSAITVGVCKPMRLH